MRVIKSSGEIQDFSSRKIYNSCRQAGASIKLSRDISKFVLKKYSRGMTTKEILILVLNLLKVEPGVSERYDLKRAVMMLGPSGFPFEDYFSRILQYHGYKVKTGNKLRGKKIYHEVDIVAEKNGKKWMVECKYHNDVGISTRLQPAMYTYARFLDLSKQNFDFPWLVTNTKCSSDARKYAEGVNLKITSWNYPSKNNLYELINNKKLYPITILKNLTNKAKEKLYSLKLLVVRDLVNFNVFELQEKTGLTEKESINVLEEIQKILN